MSERKPKLKRGSKKWEVLAMFCRQNPSALTQLEIQDIANSWPENFGVVSSVMTRVRELVAEGRLTRKVGKDGRVRWKFRSW